MMKKRLSLLNLNYPTVRFSSQNMEEIKELIRKHSRIIRMLQSHLDERDRKKTGIYEKVIIPSKKR